MTDRGPRSVLVTGAARGLGLEIALRLAQSGFGVWAGIRDPRQAAVLQEAGRQRGLSLQTVPLDVTDNSSIDAAVRTIAGQGGLFGLVNNAGITGRAYFEDFPEDQVRQIFDVNVFGTMNLTRRVLPLMREAGAGRIVMLSSVGGRIGAMSAAPYVASKFAIEGFSESLSLEMWPFGVRVSIVEPGIVRTGLWDEGGILPAARSRSSPYYELFWNTEKLATQALNSASLRPADVAETVLRAITAKRPRLRYVVGNRASFLLSLRRHLPGELFDRIYFRLMLARVTQPDRETKPGLAASRSRNE
jgi:NAD(P)-dependent dehydrogenase (short-subunit alcohol dehydrogenase family)